MHACHISEKGTTHSIILGAIRLPVQDMEGNTITSTIMLDEGSGITLIREGLAEKLQLGGPKETLRLIGITGKRSTVQSRIVRVRLDIVKLDIIIKAASVPNTCGPIPEINWPEEKNRREHLRDLPIEETGEEWTYCWESIMRISCWLRSIQWGVKVNLVL